MGLVRTYGDRRGILLHALPRKVDSDKLLGIERILDSPSPHARVDIPLVIKAPEPLLYVDLQPVVAADYDGRLAFDLPHKDVLEAVCKMGGKGEGGRGGDG